MNIRQYRDFHRDDNEWLSQPITNPDELDDYREAWNIIHEENEKAGFKDIQIEFSEDIYNNQEYGDIPQWIVVKLYDEGVLPFKMARSILSSLDGARSIVFGSHFEVIMDSGWGGYSFTRLEVYEGGAYITVGAKHSNEEIELNITEQFNQAIGEEA